MPRIFVELFAEAILSRYVVIDFPEDATLNELPWEEISEAADSDSNTLSLPSMHSNWDGGVLPASPVLPDSLVRLEMSAKY